MTFVSQPHSTINGGLETVLNFTNLTAQVYKPAGTTIRVHVQFSDDSDHSNWGVNNTFDDTFWEELTMNPDISVNAGDILGTSAGNITTVDGITNVKWIRWKFVYASSNDNYTAKAYEVAVRWLVTGTFALSGTSQIVFAYAGHPDSDGTLGDLEDTISDISGGENILFNKFIVKSKPTFEQSRETVVISDAVNHNIVLVSGNVRDYGFELKEPCAKNLADEANTQWLYITIAATTKRYKNGTNQVHSADGAAFDNLSVAFTAHSTKPYITLTASGNITITDMYLSANPYRVTGAFLVEVDADDFNASREQNGLRAKTVENNFIVSVAQCYTIAYGLKDKFQKRRPQVKGVRVCYTPQLQLWDCVTLHEKNTGIDYNFYVLAPHQSFGDEFGETTLNLIKL